MILKILIIGGGIYFFYRIFMQNAQLAGRQEDPKINDQPKDHDDGDYVDYEEID